MKPQTNGHAENARRPDLIAFYLPQFHPIPENDDWWEPGFTEWTNTAKARPLFGGHPQPHLPGELGFYDLRVPEARTAQAALAEEHGVSGFCYWHYWFAGRRMLERPFNEVLRSGEPKFPFCLGWANMDWYGNPYRLLIEQTYPGVDDHRAHFYALLEAFADERYIKLDGRPLLYVYKPALLPDSKRVTDLWRELAHRNGLKGLHLVGEALPTWNPAAHGFDAAVTVALPRRLDAWSWRTPWTTLRSIRRRVTGRPSVYRYPKVLEALLPAPYPGSLSYPCLIPNWDNTPRWGVEGMVLLDSTPENFRLHVRQAFARLRVAPAQQRIGFIKSWNEWAEGNYLEPDREHGRGFLEVLRDELDIHWPRVGTTTAAGIEAGAHS